MSYDTADEIYGPDPNAPVQGAFAAPASVPTQVPASVDPNMRGFSSLHPMRSPTPWVIALVIVLALTLHPKAGFSGGAKIGIG